MNAYITASILTTALVSYLLRVLPITLIRRQITNRFIRSVLFYLPYVTLSVMTFPAITAVAENPLCGIIAFAVTLVAAWFSENLFLSAFAACVTVFVVGLF